MPALTKDALLARVDSVLQKHAQITHRGDSMYRYLEHGSAGAFRAAGLSLLRDLYGVHHHHYVDFQSATDGTHRVALYDQAKAIIQVVKEEIAAGWLESTRGLIAAGVFSDFLEMAQHLWDEDYKDAAAVIAGSSLEAHLRRLCEANDIDIEVTNSKGDIVPKKADTINGDLVKANAYDKTEQKQVTAWLGVRNDAAHGAYDKVVREVVGIMVHGIRSFISRHPA